ncbi:MAG TPA: helix-turn-helix domain-containing protein [Solirubrobacteraceae bacterium]|nr:helix-turn-helix domain-containing protein [Solirubrobacteraceae bacterium]
MLTLDHRQVAQVVRAATDGGAVSALLGGLGDLRITLSRGLESGGPSPMDDRRLSHSLLTGLLVLALLPVDGSAREISDIVRATGMSNSSVHRYINTLVAAGLVEQDAGTRRYKIVAGSPARMRAARAAAS